MDDVSSVENSLYFRCLLLSHLSPCNTFIRQTGKEFYQINRDENIFFLFFQLTSLQTHTMAPVSFLSYGFLTQLLSNEMDKSKSRTTVQRQTTVTSVSDESDDSDDEENGDVNRRINELARLEISVGKSSKEDDEKTNIALNKLRKEKVNFEFHGTSINVN